MRRMTTTLATFLWLTVCLPAAGQDLASIVAKKEIFRSWGPAVQASSLGLEDAVKGEPLAYEAGVALYRLEGVTTGAVDYALVALAFDPTKPVEEAAPFEDSAAFKAATPVEPLVLDFGGDRSKVTLSEGSSCRCLIHAYRDINFSVLRLTANLDVNNLREFSGQNDSYSSLKTTCKAAIFFKNKNWGSSFLYVNANTSLPNLKNLGFNDTISSLYHDL